MKLHILRLSRGAAAVLFAAAVPLFASSPARAQSAQQRRDAQRVEMESRQRALRTLSDELKKRQKKERDTRPSYQQVAEDFEQLQLRNHNLSGSAESGAGLDYARIGEEAAEVRRRAARLKSTLALPAAKKDEKREAVEAAHTPEGLRAAISSLDALVKSFVWNPVFQRPDVLDAENSARAARELEEILRLSEQVRAAAEALGRGKNF
ncbi:MAG TPA: hypothetical protein VGB98_21740 [Pyrinomonadaceae bacterium]|jgi:hypothetical protein